MSDHMEAGQFFPSFKEAAEAYNLWKGTDPFPQIPPALLNSADIREYVRRIGMIYPFHEDDLLGATYTVRLNGMCVYYEEKNGEEPTKRIFCVGEDTPDLPHARENRKKMEIRDKLILEPNSITFVTLEPVFQVPDYIALRFNLKIPHVYKGLLLGTGPIIDPGFRGRLSLPLHNLTSNRYVFDCQEPIISLEVTKMSPNHQWDCFHAEARGGAYKENIIKPYRQVDSYIAKALKGTEHTSIVSSVIAATDDAKKHAHNAERRVEQAENQLAERTETLERKAEERAKAAENKVEELQQTIKNYTIAGALGILISVMAVVAAIVMPTYQLVKATADTQAEYAVQIQELEQEVARLKSLLRSGGGTWIP